MIPVLFDILKSRPGYLVSDGSACRPGPLTRRLCALITKPVRNGFGLLYPLAGCCGLREKAGQTGARFFGKPTQVFKDYSGLRTVKGY